MTQKSLYEQLLDGIGNAVTDIREKVVEEPWFGREVTSNGHEPAPEPAPANVWQEKVRESRERAEVEPSHEPDREHGQER